MRNLGAAGAGIVLLLAGLVAASQTPPQEKPAIAPEELRQLARDLGDPAFGVRELATRRLIEAGSAAVEPVAQAANTSDLEVVTRAVRVLTKLAQADEASAKGAVIRALRRLTESSHPAAASEANRALNTILAHLGPLKQLGVKLNLDDDGEVVRAEVAGPQFTDRDTYLLRRLPRLHELAFSSCNLSDTGFSSLRLITGLERLRFKSCNNLTDLTFTQLARLENLKELRFTDCRHLTGAGLKPLSGLKKLDSLGLTPGQATEEGLKSVQGFARLERLSLADAPIGDAALGHLEKLTGLRELDLTGTRVTKEGLEKIRKALPQCRVRY